VHRLALELQAHTEKKKATKLVAVVIEEGRRVVVADTHSRLAALI